MTRQRVLQTIDRLPDEGPRLLVLDIETLPMSANAWGLWDQNIGLNQIRDDWAVCAAAGKLVGRPEIAYTDTRYQPSARDDDGLIEQVCNWLHNADVAIGHNLAKFDMKKLRARAIKMGLQPFREPKIIDTMRMAKGVAAFTSNKLEYLSKTLTNTAKSSHVKYPGFELWAGIMRGEAAAWDEMEKYNVQDILSTEALYLALRPWARALPNLSHFYRDGATRCPRCGGKHLDDAGTVTLAVGEYQQYRCHKCGGLSRGRSMINSKEKRSGMLAI